MERFVTKQSAVFYTFVGLSAALFAIAPYMVFAYAPAEPVMGFIQKIFYFHVPCAWLMFLGAILSGIASGFFLATGGRRGGALSLAGAELAVLFGTLVMITGPLWAKGAWGHYWVWDVRLTTSALLYLTFIAVLVARRFSGTAGTRVAAGLALFGAINVPFVYVSVKIWSTVHPKTTVVPTLGAEMRLAFFVSLAAFNFLFLALLWLRLRTEHAKQELDEVMMALEEAEMLQQGTSR